MDKKIKIVIIEDDPLIAELHHRYLLSLAHIEVLGVAHSQHEAELQLELLKPDLLLLDVYLPDGNGLEILQKLREQKREVDAILITAAREPETLQTAMRTGVTDYLLKPVTLARLESSVKNYVSNKLNLLKIESFDQGFVDQFFYPVSPRLSQKPSLPKGIDKVTLDKIKALFNDQNRLSADETGELIGASRSTARRYLEYLVGIAELTADVQYGSVGRPERTYIKS